MKPTPKSRLRLLAFGLMFAGFGLSLPAQTTVYTVTNGTSSSSISDGGATFLFTPDRPVYLVSFSYLQADGTTPAAAGALFFKAENAGFTVEDGSYDHFYATDVVGAQDSGAVISDGKWFAPANTILLTPDHTYWFVPSETVNDVGIDGTLDERNGGAIWVGTMVSENIAFNYRLEVAAVGAVPEPASWATAAGLLGSAGAIWFRRRPGFKALPHS